MNRFCDLKSTKQIEIKEKVLTWFNEGKGYKKIKKFLATENVSISQSNLSYWKNNKNSRLKKITFEAKPSSELSYFLGVMFGDGCASSDKLNYDYPLSLSSIDKEFVEKFANCLTKLTNRKAIVPIHLNKPNMYSAHVRCKDLSEFVWLVKKDFEKAKPFIEEYPADFIQGLADSEGCPAIKLQGYVTLGVIVASSTNLALLEYVLLLLKRNYNISSKIRLVHKSGDQDSILEGRLITRTKNVFSLSFTGFYKSKEFTSKIGFTIFRKQQKLIDAIDIVENFVPSERLNEWNKRYTQRLNKRWYLKQMAPCPGFEPESRP